MRATRAGAGAMIDNSIGPCHQPSPMRLVQLVRGAGFHSFPREPALRQFEKDEGLRLVDFEKDRGVDVDADQHDARVVWCAVARIAFLSEPRRSSPARTAP